MRGARTRLCMNQEQLSDRTGIPRNVISYIENGATEMILSTLRMELKQYVKVSAGTPHFDASAGELLAQFQEQLPGVAAACPKDLVRQSRAASTDARAAA